MPVLFRRRALALFLILIFSTTTASALDKQGSAHGGDVGGEDTGFNVSGALTLGSAISNRTYAARPDNTGIALMRYAGHTDIDLIGRRLSIPLDLNMFSDRTRKGAGVFAPTELDVIGGVTTTNTLVNGADLELGARVEHDRPIDKKALFTQSYVDTRARLLYSFAKVFPKLAHDLIDGDVSGYLTLGWFTVNPTYAARPDNSGKALLRYVGHSELSIYKDYLSIGADFTFFTDRRTHPLAPSELDFTYEVIGHVDPFEIHVAYERDMPIDRAGLTQSFLYALAVYSFDFQRKTTNPLEHRGTILSP